MATQPSGNGVAHSGNGSGSDSSYPTSFAAWYSVVQRRRTDADVHFFLHRPHDDFIEARATSGSTILII